MFKRSYYCYKCVYTSLALLVSAAHLLVLGPISLLTGPVTIPGSAAHRAELLALATTAGTCVLLLALLLLLLSPTGWLLVCSGRGSVSTSSAA
jgi:hypothetical protein